MTLLSVALASTWAMHPPALEMLLRIIDRQDAPPARVAEAFHHSPASREAAVYANALRVPLQALALSRSTPVDGSHNLTRRGTVGIVSVTGPIVRYASGISAMSGDVQTVETIAQDFNQALNDPSILSILLNVDSPGGQSNGIAEFADVVFAARDRKPVHAYVSDLGASAAYWIASAASHVTVAQTAALGSIGVVAAFADPTKDKTIEIVSSMSPNKRPDVRTERGRAQWQALVDSLGTIFVNAVARNRSVTADSVIQDFGEGGLRVGQDAVDAGMADAVGSLEGTIEAMSNPALPTPIRHEPPKPQRRSASVGLREQIVALLHLNQDPEYVNTLTVHSPTLNADETVTDAQVIARVLADASLESPAPTDPDPTPQPESVPAPVAEEVRPVENPTVLTASENEELVRLRAENRRLLLDRITAQGETFASRFFAEQRAFPGEKEHIVAAYVRAALDDEHVGVDAGQPTRVTLLANLFSSRVSLAHLTQESLGTAVAQVISHRVSAPNPETDAVPADRKAQLLGHSSLGQTVLNGTSKN